MMAIRNNRWSVEYFHDGIWWQIASYQSRGAAVARTKMARESGAYSTLRMRAWGTGS